MTGPAGWETVDDAALLRRHTAGDPEAFGELVRRHRDRLWAVALRTTGDPEEAADALQDALISAFRRADSFRGDARVSTWLHRIVVNACLDRLRRRRVRPSEPLPADEDRLAELGAPVEDDPAESRERRTEVLAALARLNPERRSAIVLVDMEGYPVDEVARILGCPAGTVKSRCARGRAQLVGLLAHLREDGRDVGEERNPAEPARVRSAGATKPPLDKPRGQGGEQR